ncbi:unnamed protein product [Gongylonema pulchrum]|uniref:SLC3A2_N domain-containing protein n=1 Tax=Gongylonema pulchrum TaxID=637853 RepID=A0A183D1Q3_9BILA|nr:unnamed protein product [Gongylonema pulchrum]
MILNEYLQPPQCARSGRLDLTVHRRARHTTQSFLAALTTEEETALTFLRPEAVEDQAYSLQAVDHIASAKLFWLMLILTMLSTFVTLVLIRDGWFTDIFINPYRYFLSFKSLRPVLPWHINRMGRGDRATTVSDCSQKLGIVCHTDYTSAMDSFNTVDFLPIEKAVESNARHADSSLRRGTEAFVADTGEKTKTEILSVYLNSNYDEVRQPANRDSLYSIILPT